MVFGLERSQGMGSDVFSEQPIAKTMANAVIVRFMKGPGGWYE